MQNFPVTCKKLLIAEPLKSSHYNNGGSDVSIESINDNPYMKRKWINNEKLSDEQYYKDNPDSLIPLFEKELMELGFGFETSNQTFGFMPKHKKKIIPLAIKYYQLSKEQKRHNEQTHFMRFFNYKGVCEVVPMLIGDFYSSETPDITRWFISDCIYTIMSDQYIDDYLNIVSTNMYGYNRQMFVLLLGKLRTEKAIPALIKLLEDEQVRLHAIKALAYFKSEDFRCHFERFQNSSNPGWRKYAKQGLEKLDGSK
jgi:hypothetical protein